MPDIQTLVDQLQFALGVFVEKGSLTLNFADHGRLQSVERRDRIDLEETKRLESLTKSA